MQIFKLALCSDGQNLLYFTSSICLWQITQELDAKEGDVCDWEFGIIRGGMMDRAVDDQHGGHWRPFGVTLVGWSLGADSGTGVLLRGS
jgi:hypothetical protein